MLENNTPDRIDEIIESLKEISNTQKVILTALQAMTANLQALNGKTEQVKTDTEQIRQDTNSINVKADTTHSQLAMTDNKVEDIRLVTNLSLQNITENIDVLSGQIDDLIHGAPPKGAVEHLQNKQIDEAHRKPLPDHVID